MVSTIPWPEFDERETPLEHLVKLSRYYGSDDDFVIAAGGNTSVKIGQRLFVKDSGTNLVAATRESFVELERPALEALLSADLGSHPEIREERFKSAIMAARTDPAGGQRPSVECVLHHLLPRRFVIHSHSTVANWLTCSREGGRTAAELFGDDVLWIPYVEPGIVLARAVRRALEGHARQTGRECPPALLLQNHGLIVCGDSPEELRRHTDRLVDAIRARLGPLPSRELFGPVERVGREQGRQLIDTIAPLLRGLLADGESLPIVSFDDSQAVIDLVGSPSGKEVALRGSWTPDQIVYCNSFPLWFEAAAGETAESLHERLAAAVKDYAASAACPPRVVLAKGLGMFTAGRDYAAADTVRRCYLDAVRVAAGAERLGGVRALEKAEREFIENWEVEAYRRRTSRGTQIPGRMAGKVALVTGAAQGFGLGIAEALAAEGAHVILTDINREGATRAAQALESRYGAGRALGVCADVTDETSMAAALHETARTYGGLDLLVSNAGVLLAGSVKTQPIRDFDLVTSVNYKGYFVCVQKASPFMSLQHLAKPDYWSDIIQINSKSGLEGSNRNGAYAGSKFGGIGLTQSFALELLEDGIKVNAVCPGNYFEGPLWSDPDKGLFAQYLRSGKVPGAKTIEDVRKAYEAKVPMGRGCTVADVMKAIYYLVEQKYETGQALPVTGGQVMLH